MGQDFAVLCGSMPVFYPSLRAGAAGGVVALACALPDECVELFELFASGRQDEAAELQQSLTPLAKLVTSVHGVPGLKAALDLAGFVGGLPRPPLGAVSREAMSEIADAAAAPARPVPPRRPGSGLRRRLASCCSVPARARCRRA